MSAARYFSVDEANAVVPELEGRFTRVVQLRGQMRSVYEQLDGLGAAPNARTLLSDEGPVEIVTRRLRLRGLIELLTDELAAVEELGVSVKDVDIGLCDFRGRIGGRDVWLCWKLGEKVVAHWHEIDDGFSGRRPLDERNSQMLH